MHDTRCHDGAPRRGEGTVVTKTWIEVALNGPWGRNLQPNVPLSVAELISDGVACARAGAAIIHVHAFDDSGRDDTVGDVYASIIEGIRAEVDCLVYPSIPTVAAPGVQRFGHLSFLLERGLLDMTVVDPGSVNLQPAGDQKLPYPSLVYSNSPQEIDEGLEYCARYGIHPGFAIYEPGFTRTGAALTRRRAAVPEPVYRFMFSDGLTFGFRPSVRAVEAHLETLELEAPGAPWMVAGLDVDISPLVGDVVRLGGGVRTGLEDAPFGTHMTNTQLADQLIELVTDAGGQPATPLDVRADLEIRRTQNQENR